MRVAAAFRPDQRTNLFLFVGTGAVTLIGVVFVATSLDIKEIAAYTTHRYRAIYTLTGLAQMFMHCALVLMGGQNGRAIGAELFIVCGCSAGVFSTGYARAIKTCTGLRRSHIVGGGLIHAVEMTGAATFFSGQVADLHDAAVALVVHTCYMITATWLLVIGVFDQASSPTFNA